ncbi:tRNA (N6-threonylcarbamoyladenosine(37)-N6)-methyltransferase TrmO [Desulfosporosinus sp. PR]|uniref:tRNA (N6-threonylcarbamoyladenosine(37)-N6)-methyltransferase TrmO n=1 Tax=Candidatus Desulfosporosinus nitrosoreducens TaxID=3401928 RepID=UPI002800547E|nr:tRNA (N6-threonylcarbamoyladenosine(37)-N6)-methyltransferase TrmO [Desulfosporosinus sp. PR]MDQ7092338.1 tRNA (N6-threonylcarbamoyladenosine(37)-N6)-methyltransferase TrmO [Desulfosporosinus sp. PR]
MDLSYQAIGTIHTPYFSFNAPHQPIPDAPGDFWITLNPEYAAGLKFLDKFNYIYVLYHLDQISPPLELLTHSPWAPELEIGLFASRSPKRPNPIGLSIVKIKEIQGNEIIISGIDAYNGTPLLDIKPYIHFRDSLEDSNNGWFDTLPDKEHIMAHALGRPHEHSHEHQHGLGHEHGHEHRHGHIDEDTHSHQHSHEHPHSDDYHNHSNQHKD